MRVFSLVLVLSIGAARNLKVRKPPLSLGKHRMTNHVRLQIDWYSPLCDSKPHICEHAYTHSQGAPRIQAEAAE
jgi:hypothetical protein